MGNITITSHGLDLHHIKYHLMAIPAKYVDHIATIRSLVDSKIIYYAVANRTPKEKRIHRMMRILGKRKFPNCNEFILIRTDLDHVSLLRVLNTIDRWFRL